MHSRQREPGRGVIERCRRPADRCVARGTVRRRERRWRSGVRGRVRLLPGRQMATGITAIRWGNRQTVVVIDVAQIAGHVGMPVGQREPGCTVIENARGPRRDGMAGGAGGCRRGETGCDVIWNRAADGRSAQKGRLVAAVAISGIECVIVVYVAGRAGSRRRGHMRSGQSETGNAVVERCSAPACRRVAMGTIRGRKSGTGSGVHGSGGLLPGRQVATGVTAIGRGNRQTVVVVDVAQIAGHVRMPVGQQESRRAVIEDCGRPTDRRMARRAVRKCERRPG